MVEFYIHQDQLYWGSTQLLFTIQAATIAAGYALRNTWLSLVAFIGGAVITLILLMYVIKLERDRDVNLPIMDELANRLISNNVENQLLRKGYKPPFIRFSSPHPCGKIFIRGKDIIRSILIGLIVADIILPILF